MKQYLDLLKETLQDGYRKGPAREGMPGTKELFCRTMRFDMRDGFPLLTTKKMYTKAIVAELLWILNGRTDVRSLIADGCNIWNKDAYKFYRRKGGHMDFDQWKEWVTAPIREGHFEDWGPRGDCGQIYGYQWRRYRGWFDQLEHLVESIRNRPNSRYHVVDIWDPVSFFEDDITAALPTCAVYYQFNVRPEDHALDMVAVQRSCDLFLGVPFDIASGALLLHIIARMTGYDPGELTWVGNSVHLYENHFEQAEEQLKRDPLPLCWLHIDGPKNKPFKEYKPEDFHFNYYRSHPSIKAPLSVGI